MPQSGLAILLVDDDPMNRRLAQLVLEKAGYRVLMADGAVAALEMLKREHLDLVLMDLQMPQTDGMETTRLIREWEKTGGGHIPVVALTANVMARDRESCLQAGMDGCLAKPIRPASLLEFIENLSLTPLEPPATAEGPNPVLDRRALLLSVNNDRQLLAEIVTLFLDHADTLMARANDALFKRDKEMFEHAIHTMIGMFQSLFACCAQGAAEKLQALSFDQAAERIAETFACLEREVKTLKAALVSLSGEMCAARSKKPRIMAWNRKELTHLR